MAEAKAPMIGPPRGKKKSRQVFVYDPKKREKVYVGTAPNWTEARKLEREWEQKIKGAHSAVTIREFSGRWLTEPRFREAHPNQARRRDVSTTRQHEQMVKAFLRQHGSKRFDEVTRGDALNFVSEHPDSAKVASVLFSDAIDAGLFPGPNPFYRTGLHKTRKRDVIPLEESEVAKLAEIAGNMHGAYGPNVLAPLILWQAYVGTRPGEAAGLHRPDLDLARGEVFVHQQQRRDGLVPYTKNRKVRRIVVPPAALGAVRTVPHGEAVLIGDRWCDPVFRTPGERPFEPGSFGYYWRPVRDAFMASLAPTHWLRRREAAGGKRLELYELRHFCGSMMANLGLTDQDIAYHLGDTPEVVRRHYVHVYEDQARDRLRAAFGRNVRELREETA